MAEFTDDVREGKVMAFFTSDLLMLRDPRKGSTTKIESMQRKTVC